MNTIKFDKKCVCGPEFVCIRILDNGEEMKAGNIFLSVSSRRNDRLALGKIEDVGDIASEKYDLHVGEYVYFDRLSTFYHTAPVCLLKYNNIIYKTNKEGNTAHPLRNMLFVESEETNDIKNLNGIYVKNQEDILNTGKIIDMNCDKDLNLPFKVGDDVMVTKGADLISIGTRLVRVYKHDMIICTIK